MKNALACLLAATLAGACPANEHEHEHPHHDHAHNGHDHGSPTADTPASVMAGHTHEAGGWMISHRHMRMDMQGNRIGTARVDDATVLNSFMVTPVRMDMEMDMFGVMYAPTDELTWMLMIPRIELEMEHRNRMNRVFTTRSEGMGDISLSALIAGAAREGVRSHFQLGLRAPTGEVNEFDATPMGANTLLPYPMRLGGGTYAAILGYTQVDEGYRLGDELMVTGWRHWEVSRQAAVSARLAWSSWDDIQGADARLNPMMVPTANPDLRGGDRVDLGVGVNWTAGPRGQRFSLEYLMPLRQSLDGPQLEVDRSVVFGWSVVF
jgi:hypothetical protein